MMLWWVNWGALGGVKRVVRELPLQVLAGVIQDDIRVVCALPFAEGRGDAG